MKALRMRVKDVDLDKRHIDVRTTLIDTHVLNRRHKAVRSPLD
jgi:hypothetical protein